MTRGTEFEPFKVQILRWVGAALFVLAVHIGGAAVLIFWPLASDADVSGAIAIDLAPIASGPAVEVADVTPGPLTPEATAASEATRQTPDHNREETPPVEPSPVAPNPEVVLPLRRSEEEEKPEEKEEQAEIPKRETLSQASVASLPTAPPRSEAEPSVLPSAPALGLSTAALQAEASWQKTLASHINRYKRYPIPAHKHRIQGQVTLKFTVDRAGGVVTSQILHSSGSSVLDEEAMTMLQRAAPLPIPPALAQGATFEFVLPVRFQIK